MKFAHIAALIVSLGITVAGLAATPFEKSSAKGYLERSLQSAMAEKTKEVFMRKAMLAADTAYMLWEKEAFTEYNVATTSDDEFILLQSETRTTIQKMLAEATGRFDAQCFEIVVPEYAKEELYAHINQMIQADPRDNMAATYTAWDEEVGQYVQNLLAAIGSSLQKSRDEAIARISDATQEYQNGFITALDEQLTHIQKLTQRDIELCYVGAKNTYFHRHYSDTYSLRFYSEQQSAAEITTHILTEITAKTLALSKEVEEMLLYRVSGIGISPQGEDVEALVRAGIYAWKEAEDKLIVARFSWERAALENYQKSDELWKQAYASLAQKREEWITAVQQQIRQGIINWSDSFLETDRSYAAALQLLDETIAAERERFDDYSASVRELVIAGSGSLRVAHENSTWLKEYFTTLTGIEYTGDTDKQLYIAWYLQNDHTQTRELKQAVFNQIQQWDAILTRYNDIVARMAVQYHTQDMWGNTVTQFVSGDFVKQYTGEEKAFCDSINIFNLFYTAYKEGKISSIDNVNAFLLDAALQKYVVGIQFLHLLKQESAFQSFDSIFQRIANSIQYENNTDDINNCRAFLFSIYDAYINGPISFSGQQINATGTPTSAWLINRLEAFGHYVKEHAGCFEKVFGYKNIVSRTSGLLSNDSLDSEGNPLYEYYLYKDAEGVVVIDGIYQMAHDPYLMTAAEFDLEKEKLTLAYWEERLRRAQKLYDFAYNETGRPDAQTQKERLQQTIAEYEKAKKDYKDAMALLGGTLKDALVASQANVDTAQRRLEQVRITYEAAQKTYQQAMERCLYYSNPDAREMAIQMINEATQQIIAITNRIQDKERKWISARLDYYKSLIMNEHNTEAAQYAERVELAVKALEGYTSNQEDIPGIKAAYTTWQDIRRKPLDEAISEIDDNSELLFHTLATLMPGYENDERLAFIKEAFEYRDEIKKQYEDASERYMTWKEIVKNTDVSLKVQSTIVHKLNELFPGKNPELTWDMLQEQIDCIADITQPQDARMNAITLLSYYTGGSIDTSALQELLYETDATVTKNNAMEIFLSNVLQATYGVTVTTVVNGNIVYPDINTLYCEYEKHIQDEYQNSAVQAVYAVNALGKALEDVHQIAYNVVVYLLKDMNNENLDTSPFTKDNIATQADAAFDAANVAYYTRNRESVQTLINILQHKKDMLADSNGNIDWSGFSGMYENLISQCYTKIIGSGVNEASEYGYLYTLVNSVKDMLRIQNEEDYTKAVTTLQDLARDLDIVSGFYSSELSQCKTNEEINELLRVYTTMLDKGKDENSNPLSLEQLHTLQVKVTAMVHPDVFDVIHPVAYEGKNSVQVMNQYARYVTAFYELSLEKKRRIREKGFTGTIASILGIDKSEAEHAFKGSLTVGQLIEYGKKAESYIQTKEYSTLPQALKEALQSVVSAYHDILIQKAKYENRTATVQDALTQYQTKTDIYNKLVQLQKKYAELIALRSAMYGDEENEYTALQQHYYELSPNGTWPGFVDAVIATLHECNTLYNDIKDEIDSTLFKNLQTGIFAQLAQVEALRREYEIVDYAARYLLERDEYGSIDAYAARLRSDGKDTQCVQAVVAKIIAELQRRQDIQLLMENRVGIHEVQQKWEDTSWILAAYYEGITQSVADVDAFNALEYDEDFRVYALLAHFQQFASQWFTRQGITTFEELFGSLDEEANITAGHFTSLQKYNNKDAATVFIQYYADFQKLYYVLLEQTLAAKALKIHNTDTYCANMNSPEDVYAHFIAYMLSYDIQNIPAFEEMFGRQNQDAFDPHGFAALTQYGTQEWQEFFSGNYEVFQMLYSTVLNNSAMIHYNLLPQGVREYALFTSYFTMAHNGIVAGDAEELLAYFGIEHTVDGYEQFRIDTESFVHIMDIALGYNGTIPVEEYIRTQGITDEKEKNFLILYSISPELADPVNLIVTDSQVPLVLTGYQMQMKALEIFETLSSESDDGLLSLLAMCIYAANRDNVVAENVYQFVATQRDFYVHYRDYLGNMKQYFEDYASENNTLSRFKEFIVTDTEVLKERQLVKIENAPEGTFYIDINELKKWYETLPDAQKQQSKALYEYLLQQAQYATVDYQYYDNADGDNQHDPNEKYLADFIEEYRSAGYSIVVDLKAMPNSIDTVQNDNISTNTKNYYLPNTDFNSAASYYNEMVEKATTMAASLDMLVTVAKMATQATNTFVLHDEYWNQVDTGFIRDADMLIQELQNTGYTEQPMDTGNEEDHSLEYGELPLTRIMDIVQIYQQAGQDARVQELVDSMKESDASIQYAFLKACADIEKMGIVLANGDLHGYLESDAYKNAQQLYSTNKVLFEQAQQEVNDSLKRYHEAQDSYTRQLEIITVLYNRMEEARKQKEDEEMLYAYASTPYLYNSQTNAEGGDPDEIQSKLKSDATQQYELALQYHNEVKKKVEELQKKVEEVKKQNVNNDTQYIKIKQELQDRAQRAYRMEKTALCMQNEIKKLSVAYEELKNQYEAKKNAFITPTDDDYINERDMLVDRMLQDSYLNGIKIVKRKDIEDNTAALIAKAIVLSRTYAAIMPVGVSDAIVTKMVYDFIKDNKDTTITLNSLIYNLQQSAFYYDSHASLFGSNRKIDTEPWFGSIPKGLSISNNNSPMYEYLRLLEDNKIAPNAAISTYYSSYLNARDGEYEYENLSIVYGGYYELFKPIKKRYDYLWNKRIKVFGKKIYPLRPLACTLKPVVYMFEKAFNKIFKEIREAEIKWKNNDKNANNQLRAIHCQLTELQSIKLKMLQAKAKLARYTEIESLDNPDNAGAFVYYNPKTMQNVEIKKPTLKSALKEIAAKYGIDLRDSDLALLTESDRGEDWVNVNNYRTQTYKTNDQGYQTDEAIQVLHAGTVTKTYANIMNQQKRDAFSRYYKHITSMYTSGGYDRVVVERAVEKDLYRIWAGDSSEKTSALAIGPESPGTVRAMLAYMGFVEGMPTEAINKLDAMIGTEAETQVAGLFAQYVKQHEGINDRELLQRKALQVHQWQLTKQALADKKADWDRMVKRIFERGMHQWNMMLKSFETRWKNWESTTKEALHEGSRQWDNRMKRLQEEKLAWLVAAQNGAGYAELQKRMAGIEILLNDMLTMMQKQYGNVVKRVDVHALLIDILKDQPELLNDEIMTLSKQKVEFGLTQVTYRSYNKGILDEAQKLADDFAKVHGKTSNLALLKALTQLLTHCREQIDAANENAAIVALQFVSAYNFGINGNKYKRKLAASDREQKITAYRPFAFTDSMILGTYTIPTLMNIYNNGDSVVFQATMNVVLSQAQTRMGMMMRPDVPWGFSYYVGEFGVIEPGPKLRQKGKGEYGRITHDVYKAEQQKATEDAVCQYVNAGIAVTLSIATGNPMVGAAYMSYNQLSDVTTGNLSMQHWAVQTGISIGASAFGGYVEGVTGSAVYGSLANSSIQGLGNFVEYKQDGGLGLQWGSKQQWRSYGIGTATALIGAKLGEIYGDSWNHSWRQYGYTASSSYLVNRFDGTGSWEDDLMQSGASIAALYVSNELTAEDTAFGKFVGKRNAIAPVNRFIQGTLENAIMTGVHVTQGKSIQDALLQQRWEKTQYTVVDYLSDYAAKLAQEHGNATRNMMEMEKKEGLLGLAWLGLRKAGSLLSSIWDEVSDFFSSLDRNTDNGGSIFTTREHKDYEIVMTDTGYARKYEDGEYEYIDEVAARAEMYKGMYGGDVKLTGINGGTSQEQAQWEAYKQQMEAQGIIVEEVEKLDTSKALSYNAAMKLTGGDMKYDEKELVSYGMVYGAVLDVNTQFATIVEEANRLNLKGEERLKYVVDAMMDEYNGRKFYDETHLQYTFSAVMENLGREFAYTSKNGIGYGFAENVFNDYPKDGYMNKTTNVDCANFVTIGLNILGLTDYKGQDANLYYPERYEYDRARETAAKKQMYDSNGKLQYEYTNGVTNLLYNNSLFTRIDAGDVVGVDLTGAIGVMKKPNSYYDHIYVSVNNDGSRIVDSNGAGGIYGFKQIPKNYLRRTDSYLLLKLPKYRRY